MGKLTQYTGGSSFASTGNQVVGQWVGTTAEYEGFTPANFENYANTLFFIYDE